MDLEKEESHIILIKMLEKRFGLASIYRTYKLTHKTSYEDALTEQMSIISSFASEQENLIIVGDLNLDFNRRSD